MFEVDFGSEERVGYSPEFLKRVREKRAQEAQKDGETDADRKMKARQTYLARIEMLKREAQTARAAALRTKAEREMRESAERIAIQQHAKMTAVTDFQWIVATAMVLFDVTKSELNGDGRSPRVIPARQFVMYWARRRTGLSSPLIGRLMGGKDHTTVLAACRSYVVKRARMGRKLRDIR